jgi:lipopolysaccharide/colanic/teichoic acid biosynthesis glycosyltransferase
MLQASVNPESATINSRESQVKTAIPFKDVPDVITVPPLSAAYMRWGKRLCDILGASLLLVAALPLMLVLMALVALDGGNPIFAHPRVGLGGRSFRCLKIRTMVLDSEERLRRLLAEDPAAAEEWARDFKLRNDPRITRIGRFLRKSSLDELPQLWNVLRGDMSLVGPRPVTEAEMPLYGRHADAYRSVRPGLTGIWQVSGRNDLSFAERVELDRIYAARPSFVRDAQILFMTVPAVLHVTGC